MELMSEWELQDKDDRFKDRAACKNADPNLFFPEKNATKSFKEAAAICKTCPVSEDCLRFAMNNQIQYGVWGGLSPKQRTRRRNQMIRSLGVAQ
jgi:WhiB family redox-sensing transcriptional regulator